MVALLMVWLMAVAVCCAVVARGAAFATADMMDHVDAVRARMDAEIATESEVAR